MNGKKILLLTLGTLLAMGLGYALVGLKPPKTAASEPLAVEASVGSQPVLVYLDPPQGGSGTIARGYEDDDDDEYEEYEEHEDEDEEHEDDDDDEVEEHEDDEHEDEDD